MKESKYNKLYLHYLYLEFMDHFYCAAPISRDCELM